MKIAPFGVGVFEVEKPTLVVQEMRPGMPGRDMQLDDAVAGYPTLTVLARARARRC